jgi:hypothetical protein
MNDLYLLTDLARERYEDRLREAEESRQIVRARKLHELPAVLRTILLLFG